MVIGLHHHMAPQVLNRCLLYTAASRPKQLLIIVSTAEALRTARQTLPPVYREGLKERLQAEAQRLGVTRVTPAKSVEEVLGALALVTPAEGSIGVEEVIVGSDEEAGSEQLGSTVEMLDRLVAAEGAGVADSGASPKRRMHKDGYSDAAVVAHLLPGHIHLGEEEGGTRMEEETVLPANAAAGARASKESAAAAAGARGSRETAAAAPARASKAAAAGAAREFRETAAAVPATPSTAPAAAAKASRAAPAGAGEGSLAVVPAADSMRNVEGTGELPSGLAAESAGGRKRRSGRRGTVVRGTAMAVVADAYQSEGKRGRARKKKDSEAPKGATAAAGATGAAAGLRAAAAAPAAEAREGGVNEDKRRRGRPQKKQVRGGSCTRNLPARCPTWGSDHWSFLAVSRGFATFLPLVEHIRKGMH